MLGAPATFDTDKKRAWTTPQWAAEKTRRGIQHRFKTDRFSPNSLGMMDEEIKRVKNYIRQRLTEERALVARKESFVAQDGLIV